MFCGSSKILEITFKAAKKYSNSVIVNRTYAMKSSFETLSVSQPSEYVFHVELNRPDKLNAFNRPMWIEIGECFQQLDENENCRVVVLSGSGRLFSAGLDFKAAAEMGPEIMKHDDVSRRARNVSRLIKLYQDSISSLEKCKKPVLTAVHSACIGAAINLITAADIRYCTKDAWFQVKEVDLGLAADVGVLQRLPKVIGSDSLARELCYTARKMNSDEALSSGLVSKVFENKDSMMKHVIETADDIAKKSPVAVQGTKVNLIYSRDHAVQEGLDFMVLWNSINLQSEDFTQGVMSQITKEPVAFSKL